MVSQRQRLLLVMRFIALSAVLSLQPGDATAQEILAVLQEKVQLGELAAHENPVLHSPACIERHIVLPADAESDQSEDDDEASSEQDSSSSEVKRGLYWAQTCEHLPLLPLRTCRLRPCRRETARTQMGDRLLAMSNLRRRLTACSRPLRRRQSSAPACRRLPLQHPALQRAACSSSRRSRSRLRT